MNEIIDPIAFTMKGLDTNKVKMAVDSSLGEPIVVERFNLLDASSSKTQGAKQYYWLIVANVIVVIALLAVILLREYGRKRSLL